MPINSPEFSIREMMNSWVVPEDIRDWRSKTLNERMDESLKSTSDRLKQLDRIEDNAEALEASYR